MKFTTPATASAPYTRRCAARQDFRAADERRRNDVKVGRQSSAVRVARHHATAVDQDQRALRTEVAKIDFGGTRCAVRHTGSLSSADRRQLVQNVFDAGRTGKLHVLVGNDRDGGCGLKVRLRNTRTGDDDVLTGLNVLTLGRNRWSGGRFNRAGGLGRHWRRVLREGRRSKCRCADQQGRCEQILPQTRLHITPLIRPHGGRTWRSHCPITVTEQG